MYILIKHNNGQFYDLGESFLDFAKAKIRALTLHNPEWPYWIGIDVYDTRGHRFCFDTSKEFEL